MLNLWPFVPLVGITEQLDHLSNVFITRTTEQRLALRYWPRQTLTYISQLDNYEFARCKAFAEGNAELSVYVPIWFEAVRLGGLAATDSVLYFDTTWGDWRVGNNIVIWQSYDEYVIKTVAGIAPTYIVLSGVLAHTFRNPYVIPLRECLAKQGYQFSRTTQLARVTAQFSVQHNANLVADGTTSLPGYPVYLGLMVLPAPPFEAAQTAESIVMPTVYFDNGFGPEVGEATRVINDFGQMLSFLDRIGPDLWNRRLFLHYIRGKQVPFWFPSYNKDLQLVSTIAAGSAVIIVRSIADDPNYYLGRHIMILLKNGARYFRQIIGSSSDSDGDHLQINGALGVTVTLTSLNLICFLSKVRSNTDSFQLTMSTSDDVAMTMPVLEVPE